MDGIDNALHMRFQPRPLRMPDHHNRDLALFEILLIPEVLVRRQKQFIPRLFSDREKIPVAQAIPPKVRRDADGVFCQIVEIGTGVP